MISYIPSYDPSCSRWIYVDQLPSVDGRSTATPGWLNERISTQLSPRWLVIGFFVVSSRLHRSTIQTVRVDVVPTLDPSTFKDELLRISWIMTHHPWHQADPILGIVCNSWIIPTIYDWLLLFDTYTAIPHGPYNYLSQGFGHCSGYCQRQGGVPHKVVAMLQIDKKMEWRQWITMSPNHGQWLEDNDQQQFHSSDSSCLMLFVHHHC